MNMYKLLNECTIYKSRCAVTTKPMSVSTSNGVYVVDEIDGRVVIRKGDQHVLVLEGVESVRLKHDSIIVCTRDRLFMFHGETQETYTREIHRHDLVLYDMDVCFDPFRHEMHPWYLFYDSSRSMMVLRNGDVVVDEWRDSYGNNNARLDVMRRDCAVVSSNGQSRVYHEGRRRVFKNDTRVIDSSYLYNINKYMIQTNECFVLVSDNELQYMVEHGVKRTIRRVDESQIFYTSGACKDVYFSRYHDVVVYNCNRSRLCIAETKYPFSINPNIEIPMSSDQHATSIVVDDTTIIVNCQDIVAYMFSMFPMSFTASTSIDTIFE